MPVVPNRPTKKYVGLDRSASGRPPQPPSAPAWPAAGAGPRSSGAEDPITPPGGSVGPNGATDIGNPNHPGGNVPTLAINDPVVATGEAQGSYIRGAVARPGSEASRLGLSPQVLRDRSIQSGIRDIRSRHGFNAVDLAGPGGYKGRTPQVQQEIDQVLRQSDNTMNSNSSETDQFVTPDNQGNPVTGRTFTEGVDNPSPGEQAQDRIDTANRAMQ